MSVFHLNNLPKEKRIQMIGEFYDMINSLKNREEVRAFLKDLLTADEIATLMRRIEIAVLLKANFSYRQISDILGVGSDKINNVQKILSKQGEGYKIIIKRLLENRKERLKKIKKSEKTRMSEFEQLKKRYPGYFLLNNLLDKIIEKFGDDKDLEKDALLFTPSFSFLRKKNNKNSINKNKNHHKKA